MIVCSNAYIFSDQLAYLLNYLSSAAPPKWHNSQSYNLASWFICLVNNKNPIKWSFEESAYNIHQQFCKIGYFIVHKLHSELILKNCFVYERTIDDVWKLHTGKIKFKLVLC